MMKDSDEIQQRQCLKFNQFTFSFSVLLSGGIDIDSGTSESADNVKTDKCEVNGSFLL